VRLLKFPAWSATIDDVPVDTIAADETGQLLLRVPEGRHEIRLRFVRTRDRTAGGLISMVFVLIVGGWRVVAKRNPPVEVASKEKIAN
jgi:hypothetical protein